MNRFFLCKYLVLPKVWRQADVCLCTALWLLPVALGLSLIHLNRGFIDDEYMTWLSARLPVYDLFWQRIAAGHLPIYFLMIKGWIFLFGDTEWVMRIPSVIFAMIALGLFIHLAFRVLPTVHSALMACFIFSIHQLTFWDAQIARPYAVLLCFELLIMSALVQWWINGQKRWLIALYLSIVLGTLCHVLTIIFCVSLIVSMSACVLINKKRAVWAILTMLMSIGTLILPIIILGKTQHNYSLFSKFSFPLHKALNGLAHVFFGDYVFWSALGGLKYFVWLLILLVLFGASKRLKATFIAIKEEFPVTRFLWISFLIPMLLLTLLEGLGGRRMLSQTRYFTVFFPPMVMLMGLGLEYWQLRLKRLRWIPTCIVLGLMAVNSIGWLKTDGDGLRYLVQAMQKKSVPLSLLDGKQVMVYAGEDASIQYELRHDPIAYFETLPGDTLREGEYIIFLKLLSGDRSVLDGLSDFQQNEMAEALNDYGVTKARLEVLATKGISCVWFYIYDNYKHLHDPLFVSPPPPWKVQQFLEFKDARAVLLVQNMAKD